MGDLGKIRSRRTRSGQRGYFLYFRPYGRVWSHQGISITDRETARRLLEKIRGEVADGRSLEEVLARNFESEKDPTVTRGPSWIRRRPWRKKN